MTFARLRDADWIAFVAAPASAQSLRSDMNGAKREDTVGEAAGKAMA